MVRLRRPCNECEEWFIPTGKFTRICDLCNRKILIKGVKKRQESVYNKPFTQHLNSSTHKKEE